MLQIVRKRYHYACLKSAAADRSLKEENFEGFYLGVFETLRQTEFFGQSEDLGTHLLKKLRFNTPPVKSPSKELSSPPACIEHFLQK